MRDFVEKGFWIVLRLEDAVGLNGLCLSPAGLIPQRDLWDRIIIDYTWSGVNEDTRRLAPYSMQFGHALQRILQRMYDVDPHHGPIYIIKVDIADGFYHVGLAPGDIPSLGVCLPPGPDDKNSSHVPPSPSDGLGIPPSQLEGLGGTRPEFCHQDPGGDIPLEKVRPLGPDPRDKNHPRCLLSPCR